MAKPVPDFSCRYCMLGRVLAFRNISCGSIDRFRNQLYRPDLPRHFRGGRGSIGDESERSHRFTRSGAGVLIEWHDRLSGWRPCLGANLSNAAASSVVPIETDGNAGNMNPVVINDILDLAVSGAGAANTGQVILYVR